jgi:N-acyl-D-aspartate/D-glutamate deacylase
MGRFWKVLCAVLIGAAAARAQRYDVIIRGGTLYDGTGAAPTTADVAIRGDRIVRVAKLDGAHATVEVNATGLAVAPGFINMMSGEETLFADGRSQSDIRQGVTLEVFGEGESMGPLTPEMQKYFQARQSDIRYPITWTTLAQGLDTLAHHGISCNVASFMGAATIRENVLGFSDRAPSAGELVLRKVEAARAQGLHITADMYTYTAGATGLDASMPPWVQEGGYEAWARRMKDPAVRKRVVDEMRNPTDKWENLLLSTGSPDRVLLVGFRNDALKPLTGKTLAEVSRLRGESPEETAIDLVIEDGSRVGTIYFLMNEDNVRRQLTLPWVSFGADEDSQAPEGIFLKSNPHPRAYGNFARFLGHYVRDEKVVPMEEAVRRLSSLPAQNLSLDHRGLLKEGYFADVVVFNPATIQDSTGVEDVFVNGVQVLKDGEHTGAKPGRVVFGPGRAVR